MKSVFTMHNKKRFNIFLYATSPTDGSPYRRCYERQTDFHFNDVSSWSISSIVQRITQDQIHIREWLDILRMVLHSFFAVVNLGGYTKGSRNEIFAARPSPVQVSLMGFAGTLAASALCFSLSGGAILTRIQVGAIILCAIRSSALQTCSLKFVLLVNNRHTPPLRCPRMSGFRSTKRVTLRPLTMTGSSA